MKTLKKIIESWAIWLLTGTQSEKIFNLLLAFFALLFFGNILFRCFLFQS